ncbi:hypothetical protein BVIET440_110173 [Burkholderia vietnamiensis]
MAVTGPEVDYRRCVMTRKYSFFTKTWNG